MSNAKRILIMAGGTGGHIFPGIAVADVLRTQGWDIQWLGTAERMEAEIVPAHGYPIHFIHVTGLRGRGLVAKVSALVALFKAIVRTYRIIKDIQPQVVLGMGGYASGPGGIAAKLKGLPLAIHEQNAVAGLTNRWLATFADRVLLGFASAATRLRNKDKIEVTGNPVRSAITHQLKATVRDPASAGLRILIVGGSLGARPFNQQLPALLASLQNVAIFHQCGKNNHGPVRDLYLAEGRQESADSLRIEEFVHDISAAYDWADVVICRAGAITVTEIALAGVAAIFVPLPHAVDDHQTANANTLVERGGALLVPQPMLNTQLPALISDLLRAPGQLKALRSKALECAIGDAAERVAAACVDLARGTGGASKNEVPS
ncbi:undecaprenyldiphospho-muramoylpentapeptide beta-N-acetylglucosaminyltransferase [Alteromonas oceanisediminis]|uniref:undecaprenyldiphospho-muramoylpentapeptide beta-N-acetylglucosaminyltransferase n=1 Tax=Alteromonas oceanisediminis TaxID=2836180 RepID=UPI001BD96C7E|nr:undecaprenyldiphospho-muramoylpentapeptide beta-N-acetylglucosaminyltransferase [Alteromonas oceanisediminis]MBT0585525.1 undecaprenyldiphospho-muramoylpentapeptide beta-N-acetylglucosaminyltransferase [Alteromonas oceanisediminis]